MQAVKYTETDHYRITKTFLNDPDFTFGIYNITKKIIQPILSAAYRYKKFQPDLHWLS
jgi:hypothetical protein